MTVSSSLNVGQFRSVVKMKDFVGAKVITGDLRGNERNQNRDFELSKSNDPAKRHTISKIRTSWFIMKRAWNFLISHTLGNSRSFISGILFWVLGESHGRVNHAKNIEEGEKSFWSIHCILLSELEQIFAYLWLSKNKTTSVNFLILKSQNVEQMQSQSRPTI